MQKDNEKQAERQDEMRQPGDMASFNNRDTERSTATEGATEPKDVDESYMDYNGNSEQNAPATDK